MGKEISINLGLVAQLVRANDSSKWCAHNESYELNRVNSREPKSTDMAILSQAKSTLLEGAETSGEVKPS